MLISDVRKRVRDTIERSRRHAAARRERNEEAARAFAQFLESVAVPLFRQLANVLKIEGYLFTVFTPSGSVRLMSDRSSEDYIEIALDSSGDAPQVVAHVSRARGRRGVDAVRIVGSPDAISEDDLLAFVLKELEPFVER
jgi:hypothetical protein